MKAKLQSVRCDNGGIPIVKLKGAWLIEQGIMPDSRIAICMDTFGRITLINIDLEAHKQLKEEFQDQVHIISNK